MQQQEAQAALNDGGDVTLTGTIELCSPLSLTVPGTRVTGGRLVCSDGPAFEVSTSEVEIAGVRFHGGRDSTDEYSPSQKLVHAAGSSSAPLWDVTVRGCVFERSRGHNVWLEWCEDSTVVGNRITRYLYSGVMVVSGTRVTASANSLFDAPLSPGVANTYGIAFTDLDNTEAARSRNCAAVGNTVRQVDWEGIDTHGGDGILVNNNTILGCPRGIALVVGNETRTTAPVRCLASGNIIDGAGARLPLRHAIWLGGKAGQLADGLITGNLITGYGGTGLGAPFGLDYVDRGRTTVVDNTLPLVPWTPIDLTDSDFTPNATYPPEYMVDGHTVWLRGAVIPKTSGARTYVGKMPSAFARPSALTWWAYTKGTNPAAGGGTLTVYTDGAIRIAYGTGTDTWSYPLTGSFRAA